MVNFAIENNVKDLFLHFKRSSVRGLPEEVFSAKSIKRMALSGFKLICTNLVLSCPLIEDFSISDCNSEEGSTISVGGAKLKTVELQNWKGLEMVLMDGAECLESFSYSGVFGQHCQIINLGSCKSSKALELQRVPFTDQWLQNQVSQCSLLEILRLAICEELKNLSIRNGRLKIMDLDGCIGLVKVNVAAPNLEVFRYAKINPSDNRRCNVNISECIHLKDLQLIGARVDVTNGWTEQEISTSGFQFLENLKLDGCKFLKKIKFYAST